MIILHITNFNYNVYNYTVVQGQRLNQYDQKTDKLQNIYRHII
jgi:hypothetical protein